MIVGGRSTPPASTLMRPPLPVLPPLPLPLPLPPLPLPAFGVTPAQPATMSPKITVETPKQRESFMLAHDSAAEFPLREQIINPKQYREDDLRHVGGYRLRVLLLAGSARDGRPALRHRAAASSFRERDNLLIARSILSAAPWSRHRCATRSVDRPAAPGVPGPCPGAVSGDAGATYVACDAAVERPIGTASEVDSTSSTQPVASPNNARPRSPFRNVAARS